MWFSALLNTLAKTATKYPGKKASTITARNAEGGSSEETKTQNHTAQGLQETDRAEQKGVGRAKASYPRTL